MVTRHCSFLACCCGSFWECLCERKSGCEFCFDFSVDRCLFVFLAFVILQLISYLQAAVFLYVEFPCVCKVFAKLVFVQDSVMLCFVALLRVKPVCEVRATAAHLFCFCIYTLDLALCFLQGYNLLRLGRPCSTLSCSKRFLTIPTHTCAVNIFSDISSVPMHWRAFAIIHIQVSLAFCKQLDYDIQNC